MINILNMVINKFLLRVNNANVRSLRSYLVIFTQIRTCGYWTVTLDTTSLLIPVFVREGLASPLSKPCIPNEIGFLGSC